MKTGRDVVVGALLGPRSSASPPAPLVVSGCIMMRVCHLDTCPVGIATQNPALRARFSGKPEFVTTFFEYIAEEVRELPGRAGPALARRGDRPGRPARRRPRPSSTGRPRARPGARSSPCPTRPTTPPRARPPRRTTASSGPSTTLPRGVPRRPSTRARPVGLELRHHQRRPHRRDPARLGDQPAARRGRPARRHHRPDLHRLGRAELRGLRAPGRDHAPARRRQRLPRQGPLGRPAGRPAARRARASPPRTNIIAGNVILYGATAGEVFIRGQVGERFCVRNSGAIAVVEGWATTAAST